MYYDFCKPHKAHRLTPAMAAGVTHRLWEVSDIVKVLEAWGGKAMTPEQLTKGSMVRVIGGPFAGFRGEVEKVDERSAKVTVQVYGRDTTMDLAFEQIELVPENPN
jgi:transcription antitermination factor NusG